MARPPGEDDEARAFHEAMRDARKLQGPKRVVLAAPRPPPAAPRRPALPAAATTQAAQRGLAVEADGETWVARANGIDRRLTRKLATGKIPVEARLDLHGRSRKEAIKALDGFLAAAVAAGRRCVLVIHGRGLHSGDDGPTLRDAVRVEMVAGASAAKILACASAPPALGSAGAMVVWLRR
jgi:DNA-nicking Smr family endonuclease